MIKCENCGEMNGNQNDNCFKCRQPIKKGEKAKLKICPNCGTENNFEADICSNCASSILSVPAVVKSCPNCGKLYPLKQKECDECRHELVVIGESAPQISAVSDLKDVSLGWYIAAIFIPLIGLVYGISLLGNDAEKTHQGKKLIIFSLIAPQIIGLLLALVVNIFI